MCFPLDIIYTCWIFLGPIFSIFTTEALKFRITHQDPSGFFSGRSQRLSSGGGTGGLHVHKQGGSFGPIGIREGSAGGRTWLDGLVRVVPGL